MSISNYRLIFIDDEYIVREGIKTRIKWGENGFELVGVFENGLEAIEFIKNNEVDIVISDIYMPQMDGLQLSKLIHEKYPQIVVIILTGYDHFEYAQQAIRYSVKDFLLKPITADELENVLKRVKSELDRIKKEKEQLNTLKTTVKKTTPILKEQLLRNLVGGETENREIEENIHLLKWDLSADNFFKVLVVHLPERIKRDTKLSFVNQISGIINENDDVFINYDNCIVIILCENGRHSLEKRSSYTGKKILSTLTEKYEVKPIIGIGETVNGITNLPLSYNDAQNATEYAKTLGLSAVISIREIKNKRKLFPEEYLPMIRKIGETLYTGEQNTTKRAIEEVFSYMEKHYLTKEELTIFYAQLQFFLNTFIQEIGATSPNQKFFGSPMDKMQKTGVLAEHPITERKNHLENLNLSKCESLTTVKEYFLELIERIEKILERKRKNLTFSRTERAKKIIKQRYSDPNFSLKDIADELFLSVSQFSAIFKESTNMTFIEYLTQVRLKEAKKLLKTTDLLIYKIAERVGFNDPHYFSLTFKKNTGMSPVEFRKNLEREK